MDAVITLSALADTGPIEWRGAERLMIAAGAMLFGYLGYRLYRLGVTEGATRLKLESTVANVALSGAGPGIVFLAFGAFTLLFALYYGGASDSKGPAAKQEDIAKVLGKLEALEKAKPDGKDDEQLRELREVRAMLASVREDQGRSDQFLRSNPMAEANQELAQSMENDLQALGHELKDQIARLAERKPAATTALGPQDLDRIAYELRQRIDADILDELSDEVIAKLADLRPTRMVYEAICLNDLTALRRAFDNGADPGALFEHELYGADMNAVILAARLKRPRLIPFLIGAKVDKDALHEDESALEIAFSNEDWDAVVQLIDGGVDLERGVAGDPVAEAATGIEPAAAKQRVIASLAQRKQENRD